MVEENPYASPTAVLEKEVPKDGYASRKQAIFAGVKRGAKFGGKWMLLIILPISLLVWTISFARLIYLWIKLDYDFEFLQKFWNLHLYHIFFSWVAGLCYLTFLSALIGAMIMGIACGITYQPSTSQCESEEEMKNK
jgi:uncharacterized membrane protein